jgi:REP element-mobilizing transposase RayT
MVGIVPTGLIINTAKNKRRSIHLKHYDYSLNGLYFVTICIYQHKCLLGDIVDGVMLLNNAGRMVARQWVDLKNRFDSIVLHEFVVMPNHFHGIIEIINNPSEVHIGSSDEVDCSLGKKTIGSIVGAFKSLSTNEYIEKVKQGSWPRFDEYFWQRNYYEHIIRDEVAYLKISEYVQFNALKWGDDRYFVS